MANYNSACRFLTSLNFHYSTEWLSECVNYFKTSNPSMTESELKQEVKQQWLLSNLRDMKVSVFPPNLKTCQKTVLTGKYACQVETMYDCGQSRYSQLQTLRNRSCDNVKVTLKKNEDDLPARRCLALTLTDGVQDLKAMEYELVPCLKSNDVNLLPGFKMLISGPVVCRRGMIMLSAKNVEICGGEVDDLIEKNRLESLLAGALGLDPSEQPGTTVPMMDTHQPVAAIATRIESDERINRNNSTTARNEAPIDDLLDNDDFLFDLPMEEEPTAQGFTANEDVPMKTVSSSPFVYLAQICEDDVVLDRIFKIKAVIVTLKTKISVKGEEFTLRAKICDGSLAIDVEFCSDVLEGFLGFTPSEMVKMVREKNKNSAVAERLKSAFMGAQNKLIALNCILHVKFFANKDVLPVVMSLEEISRKHLNEMCARKI